jgi:Tfp pilus assembly protein PilW
MITNEQIAILKDHLRIGDAMWGETYPVTAALRAAIATIEALPVTRDGVWVVPGMTLYERMGEMINDMPDVQGVTVRNGKKWTFSTVYYGNGCWSTCELKDLFAIRENAELAAREGQE